VDRSVWTEEEDDIWPASVGDGGGKAELDWKTGVAAADDEETDSLP